MKKLFCSFCDTQIYEDDRNCPSCGAGTKTAIYFDRENRSNKSDVLGEKGDNHKSGYWWSDVVAMAITSINEKGKNPEEYKNSLRCIASDGSVFLPPWDDVGFNKNKNEITFYICQNPAIDCILEFI